MTDPYEPMDHSLCPADDHDFVYEPGDYDSPQAHAYDRLACNDCHQPMFYCERDSQYHHAGADIEPCFLINEPGQDVNDPIYCTRCGRPACGGADCRDLTDEAAAENKRLARQDRQVFPIGQPYTPDPEG
jgi:hypothetical protein